MKELISGISFSGDETEYNFNAQRLSPSVNASITINNSTAKLLYVGHFIDDSDVIMNIRFKDMFGWAQYEVHFYKRSYTSSITRQMFIQNFKNNYSQQWTTQPSIRILHSENGSGKENIVLEIPAKANHMYTSANITIEVSLISGNFDFNIGVVDPNGAAQLHSGHEYYSLYLEEVNNTVLPIDPPLKPKTEGSLWISTT